MMKNGRNSKSRPAASRRALRFPLLVALAASLIGCVTTASMTIADAGRLRRNMSSAEAQSVLLSSPRHEITLDEVGDSGPILVDDFLLVSGDYSSRYLLAFSDGRLLYWGYPHEFARSRDPLVNAIGEQAVSRLKELDEAELQAWRESEKERVKKGSNR
jgi:hypothetical protein